MFWDAVFFSVACKIGSVNHFRKQHWKTLHPKTSELQTSDNIESSLHIQKKKKRRVADQYLTKYEHLPSSNAQMNSQWLKTYENIHIYKIYIWKYLI